MLLVACSTGFLRALERIVCMLDLVRDKKFESRISRSDVCCSLAGKGCKTHVGQIYNVIKADLSYKSFFFSRPELGSLHDCKGYLYCSFTDAETKRNQANLFNLELIGLLSYAIFVSHGFLHYPGAEYLGYYIIRYQLYLIPTKKAVSGI